MTLNSPKAHLPVQAKGEALLRKRQEIDEEVAAFRAQKEEEYKRFEEEIESGGTLRDRELHGGLGDKPVLNDGGYVGINTQGRTAHSKERDDELEKVFGPSFLPLLEKMPQESSQLSAEGRSRLHHNSGQQEEEIGYPVSIALPSTSLPASPLQDSSNLNSNHTLEGTPVHHRRTSSSRSDVSAGSLRSSLRDPQQPRSPKRVLFTIDDVVVSPSTSPIQERSSKGHSLPVHESRLSQGLGIGSQSKETMKDTGGSRVRTKVMSGNPLRNFPSSPLSGYRANGQRMISFASDAAAMSIPNTSTSIEGDDFESVDIEEDVFGFDDQSAAKKHAHVFKFDLEEDFGSDEDHGKENDVTSTSPHAGSLPIEIKWPLRPDPRKD